MPYTNKLYLNLIVAKKLLGILDSDTISFVFLIYYFLYALEFVIGLLMETIIVVIVL